MPDDLTIEAPRDAYVRIERKKSDGNYGHTVASVSIPVAVGTDTDAFFKQVPDLLDALAVELYNALNIDYEIVEGRPVEKPAAVVAPAPRVTTAQAVDNVTQGFTGNPAGPPSCPVCKGPMWDNTQNKRNPNSPDYKCKDKVCGADKGVIWPPKQGR